MALSNKPVGLVWEVPVLFLFFALIGGGARLVWENCDSLGRKKAL